MAPFAGRNLEESEEIYERKILFRMKKKRIKPGLRAHERGHYRDSGFYIWECRSGV